MPYSIPMNIAPRYALIPILNYYLSVYEDILINSIFVAAIYGIEDSLLQLMQLPSCKLIIHNS